MNTNRAEAPRRGQRPASRTVVMAGLVLTTLLSLATQPAAEAKAAAAADPVSEAQADIRRLMKEMDRAADLGAIRSARAKLAETQLRLACLQLGTDFEAARTAAQSARDFAIANSGTHLLSGQLISELGKPGGPDDSVRVAICGPS